MREAGADKHRKRFLVYGGGTLIALALDTRIRQATANTKSLDDVMRRMYEEFGKRGTGYSYDDIVRITTTVIGSDMTDFFDRYVLGHDTLDIAPSFETMGLRLDTMMDEFYLTETEKPSELQRQIRKALRERPDEAPMTVMADEYAKFHVAEVNVLAKTPGGQELLKILQEEERLASDQIRNPDEEEPDAQDRT